MTPTDDHLPRRPKPINRQMAERIAENFHATYERLAPQHGYETREASRTDWSSVPENNRELMIATVYSLLDNGLITDLHHDETHAVVEALMEAGVEYDHADAVAVDESLKVPLLAAFRKLAFWNGRHYGLTNFDMGIEEDPS